MLHEPKAIPKYQVEKYGKDLVLVEPSYASKACATCGRAKEDSTLADRSPANYWVADRDHNPFPNALKRSGRERPVVPVIRPPPAARRYGKEVGSHVRAG